MCGDPERTTHAAKKPASNHKHLSYEDRKTIEAGLGNRRTKADIARILNKDPSTAGKKP